MAEKQRTKKNTAPADASQMTFETALAELEATIEQLEQPDLTLDTSLGLFERGITLLRTCDSRLKNTQGKITELLKGENGEFVEKVLGITLESFISKDAIHE